jgi:hypothetical protein
MGGLGYRHFWRVAEATSNFNFRWLSFIFFCYFFAMRLRVCVYYMFKFGAGGLPAIITKTRGLFSVVLRQCLSDFTIQHAQPGIWAYAVAVVACGVFHVAGLALTRQFPVSVCPCWMLVHQAQCLGLLAGSSCLRFCCYAAIA